MVAAMEGANRAVFRIACELAQNSRSGLTVRFLSKKLEVPQEEIEYLVDVNHTILFTDLTKIKLVAEGFGAVKRITEGLENRGDIPALFRKTKTLSPHDFRRLEEHVDIEQPGAKKAVAQRLVDKFYTHPDSIVEYVATRGFSPQAREVFDLVWQSKAGVISVPKVRAACDTSEYEVEQALWELFRGLALFEMFRFDAEDRLVRVSGLLSEVRQWREENARTQRKKTALKSQRSVSGEAQSRALDLTDLICQLVAAIAAKPVRLRGDGELFREDWRRLCETVSEEAEPSLNTCLWAAEGVGWLSRVDDELRAGELDALISVDRFDRHRILFDWMMSTGNEGKSRRVLARFLDDLKPKAWYGTLEFIQHAMRVHEQSERPVLKAKGGHYGYLSPSAASSADKSIARSLDETFFWLGVIEKASEGTATYFRVTDLGRCLLTGKDEDKLKRLVAKPSAEIIVQPNFDIVVPTQDMDPLLTVPLDQFAVRQSTGQATVYQLSKESFTQGLQDGHDGDAFVEFLLAHNRRGALPANVMTTLDDWRGGLRRLRLRTIHVLEAEDPLVMADLLHRRKLKKHLTSVDSQRVVTYAKISKADLAKQLEKDGFIVE